MCSACAMAAMAGAVSVRAWVALHVPYLADPKRLRVATIGLLAAGTLVSSVAISGSTAPAQASRGAGSAHQVAAAR